MKLFKNEIKKLIRSVLFFLLIFIAHVSLNAQVTTMTRDWKFKTGDSLQWALPDYCDAHWNNLKAGLWWAHAGYEYGGFAWYRKKIFISSQIKPAVIKLGSLKLSLGQIQDVDQTFLNGKLIGQTGSITPFNGKWGQPRYYFVKADHIKWDAENIIAVRVYGPNNNGGMHTGPYTYEPYKITFKDYVSVYDTVLLKQNDNQTGKNQFSVVFNNRSQENYYGVLKFLVSDTSGKVCISQGKQICLKYGSKVNIYTFGKEDQIGEGCVTSTWIQLNYQLFTLTGDLKYFDQLEKSVFNHLLGAENPQTGCVSYFTPLQDKKPYSCDITCCLSSIPRGISMIPLFNYGKQSGIPTILLYESGEIRDTVRTPKGQLVNFKLHSVSNLSENGNVVYTITLYKKSFFPISFRVPTWTNNFTATVFGETFNGTHGQYLTIHREWETGDEIKINFNILVSIVHGGKNYPNRIAIKRGPYILSADSSLNPLSGNDTLFSLHPNHSIPELQDAKDDLPAQWVGEQAYRLNILTGKGLTNTMLLVPFSDASQTGAKAQIWFPIANSK